MATDRMLPFYAQDATGAASSSTFSYACVRVAAGLTLTGLAVTTALCADRPVAATAAFASLVRPTAAPHVAVLGPYQGAPRLPQAPGAVAPGEDNTVHTRPAEAAPQDPPLLASLAPWLLCAAGGLVGSVVTVVVRRLRRSAMPHLEWSTVALSGLPNGQPFNIFDDKRPPRALRLFLSPWARPQEGTAAEGLLQVPEPPAVELRPVIEPKTFTGELLKYAVQSKVKHFDVYVKDRIEMLSDKRKQQREELKQVSFPMRKLYRRIDQVRRQEQQGDVEDVLYYSVLHNFCRLGVSPIQPDQLRATASFVRTSTDLKEVCAPTPEEQQLLEHHLVTTLGSLRLQAHVNPCMLQVFQIFATSVLFGYYLRRTAPRFLLARDLGLVPPVVTLDDTKAKMEQLFKCSKSSTADPDAADPITCFPQWGRKLSMKEYVDGLDPHELMGNMQMSQEAANVIHTYIMNLFGDVSTIAKRIQEEMKKDSSAMDPLELHRRIAEVVAAERGHSLAMDWRDLRRLTLEAVAFGCFLRDAEATVELTAEQPLLTPATDLSFL